MYVFWTYIGNYAKRPVYIDGASFEHESELFGKIRKEFCWYSDDFKAKAVFHCFCDNEWSPYGAAEVWASSIPETIGR